MGRPAGRPTKLNAELQTQIVADIEKGNYAETAALAAGIESATYHNWMKWGAERKSQLYAAFFDAVTCARARAELDLVDRVKSGDGAGEGFGPAKAAAFILERTRPRKFAQRINVKVQDELERLLDVVQRVCSAQDFGRVLAELAAADSPEEAGDAEGSAGPSVH